MQGDANDLKLCLFKRSKTNKKNPEITNRLLESLFAWSAGLHSCALNGIPFLFQITVVNLLQPRIKLFGS